MNVDKLEFEAIHVLHKYILKPIREKNDDGNILKSKAH